MSAFGGDTTDNTIVSNTFQSNNSQNEMAADAALSERLVYVIEDSSQMHEATAFSNAEPNGAADPPSYEMVPGDFSISQLRAEDRQPNHVAWDDAADTWDERLGLAPPPALGADVAVEVDVMVDRNQNVRQRMMRKAAGTTTVVSAYPAGEETTKAMIGLGFVAGSLFFNLLAVVSLSLAVTLPQFSYVNATRINVYLMGEGTGGLSTIKHTLPDCMAASFASVLWHTVGAEIVAIAVLLLLPTCWLCGTTRWRFVRPCLMMCAAVVGLIACGITIQQYKFLCKKGLRFYRAERGFWNLLLGASCCLLVAVGNFAQISRYPLSRFPLKVIKLDDTAAVEPGRGAE